MSYRILNVAVIGIVGVVALLARDAACTLMGVTLALAMVAKGR